MSGIKIGAKNIIFNNTAPPTPIYKPWPKELEKYINAAVFYDFTDGDNIFNAAGKSYNEVGGYMPIKSIKPAYNINSTAMLVANSSDLFVANYSQLMDKIITVGALNNAADSGLYVSDFLSQNYYIGTHLNCNKNVNFTLFNSIYNSFNYDEVLLGLTKDETNYNSFYTVNGGAENKLADYALTAGNIYSRYYANATNNEVIFRFGYAGSTYARFRSVGNRTVKFKLAGTPTTAPQSNLHFMVIFDLDDNTYADALMDYAAYFFLNKDLH